MQPTASLAVFIYNFSGMPYPHQIEMAWAASLVLVLLVLALNITGQTSPDDKSRLNTSAMNYVRYH